MYLLENLIQAIDSLWSLGFQLCIILTIYLVPTIISYTKHHEKRGKGDT